MIAATPEPPYSAVIFSNQRAPGDGGSAVMPGVVSGLGPDTAWGSTRGDGEAAKRLGGPPSFMSARMVELAQIQPGFLGVESARDPEGFGVTVSSWRDEAFIAAWKAHVEHEAAQRLGRERWYEAHCLRFCRVARAFILGERP